MPIRIPLSFPTKDDLFQALEHIGIRKSIIDIISSESLVMDIKSNQVLIKPGQVCSHIYYVLNGGFVCRYINYEHETEKTINFYLNNLHPFMACLDSYFTQSPTSCELRAIAASQVLALPKKTMDDLIIKDKNLQALNDQLLITALMEENDLKLKLIAYKPDTLYKYLLQEFPMLIQKIPSKYIAEFMGISAEWLSKLKSKQQNNS
ncbi:MAG: cyclic nucleotide-binding domain-containing protein [Chitinophagales bacterium]|nr:cyclic nucleotide-binding domain-containing protein [Chitinophagales bacterium]